MADLNPNFLLLRDSANYFFSNEYYEEASSLYEKASVYFDSPESLLSASIAYIKLSEKISKKKMYYLKKALKSLNKIAGKWSNPMVNYYRGIVLSLLGEYEEASKDFDYVYENITEISDFAISTNLNISSFVPYFDSYVYEYLYEEPLVKLYRLLSPYEIGEERLNILKNLYGEEDDEMAKAREIKRIYKKVYSSKKLRKFLWTSIANEQAAALLYMWNESEKAYNAIMKNSKGYFILTENLPPLTASILDAIAGVKFKKKGLPFFVEIEIEKITQIGEFFKRISKTSNLNKVLIDIVDFVYDNGIEVEPIKSDRIYRTDVLNYLREVLVNAIDKLYRRAISYYSSKETANIIKAVIEPLPLSKKEKEDIFLSYSVD